MLATFKMRRKTRPCSQQPPLFALSANANNKQQRGSILFLLTIYIILNLRCDQINATAKFHTQLNSLINAADELLIYSPKPATQTARISDEKPQSHVTTTRDSDQPRQLYDSESKRLSYDTIHRILRDENEPLERREWESQFHSYQKRASYPKTEHAIVRRAAVTSSEHELFGKKQTSAREKPLQHALKLTQAQLVSFDAARDYQGAEPSAVYAVDLSSNRLATVNLSAFTSLQKADLSNNALTQIPLSNSTNNQQVTILNLNGNRIEHATAISTATLRELHLSGNRIAQLSHLNLSMLSALETLDLSCNRIAELETAFFPQRMRNLKYLNLAENRIGTIYRETFYNLLSLNTLLLSHNNITDIDYETFLALPNLQYLDLSHNRLNGEAIRALQGIPDLVRLSIAYNPEVGASMQEFVASWSLKELDASGTGLCQIPAALAQSVRIIKLTDNWLKTINCGDLDSYPLLQYLDLSHSHIEDIEDDALGRLEILETLFLDHNQLHKVPVSLPTSLEHLFLHNNEIMDIQAQSFQGLNNLQTLDLSGNKLLYLPALLLPKLLTLNLRASGIRGVSQALVHTLPSLRDLLLDENPIKCSDLLSIAEWASPCRIVERNGIGNGNGDGDGDDDADERGSSSSSGTEFENLNIDGNSIMGDLVERQRQGEQRQLQSNDNRIGYGSRGNAEMIGTSAAAADKLGQQQQLRLKLKQQHGAVPDKEANEGPYEVEAEEIAFNTAATAIEAEEEGAATTAANNELKQKFVRMHNFFEKFKTNCGTRKQTSDKRLAKDATLTPPACAVELGDGSGEQIERAMADAAATDADAEANANAADAAMNVDSPKDGNEKSKAKRPKTPKSMQQKIIMDKTRKNVEQLQQQQRNSGTKHEKLQQKEIRDKKDVKVAKDVRNMRAATEAKKVFKLNQGSFAHKFDESLEMPKTTTTTMSVSSAVAQATTIATTRAVLGLPAAAADAALHKSNANRFSVVKTIDREMQTAKAKKSQLGVKLTTASYTLENATNNATKPVSGEELRQADIAAATAAATVASANQLLRQYVIGTTTIIPKAIKTTTMPKTTTTIPKTTKTTTPTAVNDSKSGINNKSISASAEITKINREQQQQQPQDRRQNDLRMKAITTKLINSLTAISASQQQQQQKREMTTTEVALAVNRDMETTTTPQTHSNNANKVVRRAELLPQAIALTLATDKGNYTAAVIEKTTKDGTTTTPTTTTTAKTTNLYASAMPTQSPKSSTNAKMATQMSEATFNVAATKLISTDADKDGLLNEKVMPAEHGGNLMAVTKLDNENGATINAKTTTKTTTNPTTKITLKVTEEEEALMTARQQLDDDLIRNDNANEDHRMQQPNKQQKQQIESVALQANDGADEQNVAKPKIIQFWQQHNFKRANPRTTNDISGQWRQLLAKEKRQWQEEESKDAGVTAVAQSEATIKSLEKATTQTTQTTTQTTTTTTATLPAQPHRHEPLQLHVKDRHLIGTPLLMHRGENMLVEATELLRQAAVTTATTTTTTTTTPRTATNKDVSGKTLAKSQATQAGQQHSEEELSLEHGKAERQSVEAAAQKNMTVVDSKSNSNTNSSNRKRPKADVINVETNVTPRQKAFGSVAEETERPAQKDKQAMLAGQIKETATMSVGSETATVTATTINVNNEQHKITAATTAASDAAHKAHTTKKHEEIADRGGGGGSGKRKPTLIMRKMTIQTKHHHTLNTPRENESVLHGGRYAGMGAPPPPSPPMTTDRLWQALAGRKQLINGGGNFVVENSILNGEREEEGGEEEESDNKDDNDKNEPESASAAAAPAPAQHNSNNKHSTVNTPLLRRSHERLLAAMHNARYADDEDAAAMSEQRLEAPTVQHARQAVVNRNGERGDANTAAFETQKFSDVRRVGASASHPGLVLLLSCTLFVVLLVGLMHVYRCDMLPWRRNLLSHQQRPHHQLQFMAAAAGDDDAHSFLHYNNNNNNNNSSSSNSNSNSNVGDLQQRLAHQQSCLQQQQRPAPPRWHHSTRAQAPYSSPLHNLHVRELQKTSAVELEAANTRRVTRSHYDIRPPKTATQRQNSTASNGSNGSGGDASQLSSSSFSSTRSSSTAGIPDADDTFYVEMATEYGQLAGCGGASEALHSDVLPMELLTVTTTATRKGCRQETMEYGGGAFVNETSVSSKRAANKTCDKKRDNKSRRLLRSSVAGASFTKSASASTSSLRATSSFSSARKFDLW